MTSDGNGWGTPPGGGFGQPPQAGGGEPPAQGSGFGQPPQGGFGQPPQGGFGQPPQGGFGQPPQGGGASAPKSKSPAKWVALGCLGLCLVSCCGLFGWAGYMTNAEQERFAALAAACDGQPVPGTLPHPAARTGLRVMERNAAGGWRVSVLLNPTQYEPAGVAQTSLVLCVEESTEQNVERCEFIETMWGVDLEGSEASFPRTRQVASARLVSPATGATLVTGDLFGASPSCDSWSGDAPSESDFVGDAIDEAAIYDWVTPRLSGDPKPN